MEGSGETECSKTSPCEKNDGEDESEGNNESRNILKDGGTSSNSTVEESEKKPSARPYLRSKMPRLRWTPDLHLRFVQAVERLGGQERATPKLVLQLMKIKGLSVAHVKSHLQMYRSKKIDVEPYPGLSDHRLFMEGVDRNMYNLSQLPLLSRFNIQSHHSNFRYGDASWNGHGNWTHSSSIVQNTSNKTKPGFDGSVLPERILGSSHCSIDRPCTRISSFIGGSTRPTNEDLKDVFGSLQKQEPCRVQSGQNPIDQQRSSSEFSRSNPTGFKRKSSDCELDLNLSLGLESKNDEQQGKLQDAENLRLSLCTAPSSSKLMKKVKEDFSRRGASTLDLTL